MIRIKTLYKCVLSLLLVVVALTSTIAQDKIILKDKKVINCRITKIDNSVIEYLDPGENFGSIEKVLVKEVIFSKTPRTPIDFSNDRTSAIQLNLFSLVQNALQISYEKALDPSSSLELEAKIYGVSVRPFEEVKYGGALTLGFRFRIGDIFNSSNSKAHSLDGFGIKPTIGGSYAQAKKAEIDDTYYYVMAGGVLDYQIILRNRLILELYAGLHIYKGKSTIELPNTQSLTGTLDFQDGDLNGEDNVGMNYGMKFGYLFGSYNKERKVLRW